MTYTKQSAPPSMEVKDSSNKISASAFHDQRASTNVQLKQQTMMQAAQPKNILQRLGAIEDESLQAEFDEGAPAQLQEAAAEKPNNTGLPNQLKAGIESLSGINLDNVNVHYNSDKPAQLNAHAYAQGTDIHVAPGQERHLPHEAWHVVQQAQGRVKPTVQMKTGIPVNDDAGLEFEADVMGAKALTQVADNTSNPTALTSPRHGQTPAQLRAASHAYFADKWTDRTWETYQPPGSPARTSLADVDEEITDAKKASDEKRPNALNLARAWMSYAFARNFGGPGKVEDVYVAKDDQDAGGYSFSQLVNDIPLIVIHAHMEKSHIPAAAGEGDMGPVHWK